LTRRRRRGARAGFILPQEADQTGIIVPDHQPEPTNGEQDRRHPPQHCQLAPPILQQTIRVTHEAIPVGGLNVGRSRHPRRRWRPTKLIHYS